MSRQIKKFVNDFYADIDDNPVFHFLAMVKAVNSGVYGTELVIEVGEVLHEVVRGYQRTIWKAYDREGGLKWEACQTQDCHECAECVFTLSSDAREYLDLGIQTYSKMMERYTEIMKFEAVSGEATEESAGRIADYALLAFDCALKIKKLSM